MDKISIYKIKPKVTLGSWTGIWIWGKILFIEELLNLKNEKHQIPQLCVDFVCALIYRVFIKYCAFSQEFSKNLPPLPRQHSAAIGCTNNYHPIGVTVHSQCVDCTLAMRWELWRSLTVMKAREGLQWIVKKHNILWTPCSCVYRVSDVAPGRRRPTRDWEGHRRRIGWNKNKGTRFSNILVWSFSYEATLVRVLNKIHLHPSSKCIKPIRQKCCDI